MHFKTSLNRCNTHSAVERSFAEDDLTLFVNIVSLSRPRDRANTGWWSSLHLTGFIQQTVLIAPAQQYKPSAAMICGRPPNYTLHCATLPDLW